MKRIVIDTNVLISSLLFGGSPGELITLWKKGKILPICSKEIIDEYIKVLAYPKFDLTEKEIDFLLTHEILPFFEVTETKPGKSFVKTDPSDDKFIWCAIAGKAKVIISGDEHLLQVKNPPVPVQTVSEFLKSLK